MKKEYIVGGLAIVGAIALITYYNKPKRNSEGFFGASGRVTSISQAPKGNCAWCKDSEGVSYHTGKSKSCDSGDRCISRYA